MHSSLRNFLRDLDDGDQVRDESKSSIIGHLKQPRRLHRRFPTPVFDSHVSKLKAESYCSTICNLGYTRKRGAGVCSFAFDGLDLSETPFVKILEILPDIRNSEKRFSDMSRDFNSVLQIINLIIRISNDRVSLLWRSDTESTLRAAIHLHQEINSAAATLSQISYVVHGFKQCSHHLSRCSVQQLKRSCGLFSIMISKICKIRVEKYIQNSVRKQCEDLVGRHLFKDTLMGSRRNDFSKPQQMPSNDPTTASVAIVEGASQERDLPTRHIVEDVLKLLFSISKTHTQQPSTNRILSIAVNSALCGYLNVLLSVAPAVDENGIFLIYQQILVFKAWVTTIKTELTLAKLVDDTTQWRRANEVLQALQLGAQGGVGQTADSRSSHVEGSESLRRAAKEFGCDRGAAAGSSSSSDVGSPIRSTKPTIGNSAARLTKRGCFWLTVGRNSTDTLVKSAGASVCAEISTGAAVAIPGQEHGQGMCSVVGKVSEVWEGDVSVMRADERARWEALAASSYVGACSGSMCGCISVYGSFGLPLVAKWAKKLQRARNKHKGTVFVAVRLDLNDL